MTIMGWWGGPVLHHSNGFISCRYAKGALHLQFFDDPAALLPEVQVLKLVDHLFGSH